MPRCRMEFRAFDLRDERAVIALWQRCSLVRPVNDSHRDLQRKLRVRPDSSLVGEFQGRIVASVMTGYEGHRGWLNYLAVAPVSQRQ